MNDLFGYEPEKPTFVDIRNQRDSVAEEKARLCLQLNKMVKKVPPSINSGSINYVRKWKQQRERGLKVLNNKRSTRTELQVAVTEMSVYEEVPA